MRTVVFGYIALAFFSLGAGFVFAESGTVPEKFNNLVYDGKDSLHRIQDAAMKAWDDDQNNVALAIARQTMYALDQDIAIKLNPIAPSTTASTPEEKEWLAFVKQQADKGNPFYQEALGVLYYTRTGVNLDKNKAMAFCKLAADQGLALAQRNLGTMHEDCGNDQKAAEYFRMAGEQGMLYGWYNLGKLYANKDFDGYNIAEAIKYWQKAADAGFASAQVKVAAYYLESHPDNATSLKKRVEWAKKAALQGDPEAINFICYFRGVRGYTYELQDLLELEIPDNEAEAVKYLAHASRSYHLGEDYLLNPVDGRCAPGLSLDYLSDITRAKSLFPEVSVDYPAGKAEIRKYTMNTHGCGVDGIRFTLPPKRGSFNFVFAVPKNVFVGHHVAPAYLQWMEATDPLTECEYKFANAPWPTDYLVYFEDVQQGSIVPEKENILSLIFNTTKPVDVYVGFSYANNVKTRTIAGFNVPLPPNDEGLESLFGLEFSFTPNEMLSQAAKVNNREFIDCAISQGANIKEVPVLSLSVVNHNDLDMDVIKHMLKLGADPKVGMYGGTAFHTLYMMGMGTKSMYQNPAVVQKVGEVLDLFIQAGGSVNAQDKDMRTPLMYATYTGNPKIVRQLLERGADPMIADENGKTAMDWCESDEETAMRNVMKEFIDKVDQ